MSESKDTIKFWTFLTVMLLAVAVAVTLIDLTIKASILTEAAKVRAMLEAVNGQEISGRTDERNNPDPSNNGHLSGDVLDTGNAGLEEGGLARIAKEQARTRPQRRNIPRPSDGD